ncbi:ParA family protein [Butyrivibrio sp. INlla16]|uniref:ParA family protein n=1 Tax=Butyrivibrio sp. INlla16 TaxID=1520807 RepID=UPI0008904394|nr:ParA family protein [Butyrivibrio sp. INlla16]SDB68353.1 chromosome partitioning protein [Butyrivibrio sp. INlla16]
MATVICVANQKGGIGKTTTATAIASILNEKKHKTLLIDADPQGNSTDTYRGTSKDTATLFDVILDLEDPLPINEAIQHTEIGDIIASDPLLKEADTKFPSDGDEYFRLKEALEKLEGYEYVVIDTAPADNKLLKNCLVAANKLVIPITADRYAIQGLSDLNKTIATQKKRNNPNLEISGLLLVKYKQRQTLAKEVKTALEDIAEKMNTKVFNTTIRESAIAQKAQAARTTLIKYDSKCTTATDYKDFVKELLKGEK